MIYLTGDTHGEFKRVERFCYRMGTHKSDILIILGDAAINYIGGVRDFAIKEQLQSLPITLFCVHGNHEARPETVGGYRQKTWHGGIVFVEPRFPNIIFAKDGEIYDFAGKKTIVIGGAYSVDKDIRLLNGWKWWPDEQPSEETKKRVEQQLTDLDWKIDVVLSHTVPRKYEPIEKFLPDVDQSKVDKSTENWLDSIEDRLSYERWYAGHYHTDKKVDKLELLFKTFDAFPS